MRRSIWQSRLGWLAVGVLLVMALAWLQAGQPLNLDVSIDADDIGGVVNGARGPEAGVWVIAETADLPTRFYRIVVTDDRGRFVVPDLPKARYSVWVRGYGLTDSRPVQAEPGQSLSLQAAAAATPQEAAQIYPANYWYSLAEPPKASEFPGTGDAGNGISERLTSQAAWVDRMKQGCELCHQLGDMATREIPRSLGTFDSTFAAWDRRVQVGQRGPSMSSAMNAFGRRRGLEMYADWTDRVATGEVPPQPPRPSGVERNVVITMWDWGTRASYLHDMSSTDRRRPTVNPNGKVYGVDYGNDLLTITDPVANSSTFVKLPVAQDPATMRSAFPHSITYPSPYWGEEVIWNNIAHPHTNMLDQKGRVWMTSDIRSEGVPEFCRSGSSHPSAARWPTERNPGMELVIYDPGTAKFTLIDTCFGTHHLQFSEDKDDTLWLSSPGGDNIGWFKTRVYDETGDPQAAQGWCAIVVDTNGDGAIGEYTDIGEPPDPKLDRRFPANTYGIFPNPADGTIWGASTGPFPGKLVRLDPGSNPPATCRGEVYEPPVYNAAAPEKHGYAPRGVAVDRNGIVWAALSGSGSTASFDRRKCKVLDGPTATGQHCPEGWTMYSSPGPHFKGVTSPGSADFHYYNWVDQFNTLGLGENIPITNGSGSDSLLALKDGQWVVLRVPYPLGMFSRGIDGRVDDPKAGWKGRGLWTSYNSCTPWHEEGGRGTLSKLAKFQLRPTPLDH